MVGESAGSRIWYMTFRKPVERRTELEALPAVVREDGELRRLMSLRVDHLGDESAARLELPDGSVRTESVQFGIRASRVGRVLPLPLLRSCRLRRDCAKPHRAHDNHCSRDTACGQRCVEQPRVHEHRPDREEHEHVGRR